jgi:transaldolase
MNRTRVLTERGVSIWLDTLSRELAEDGGLSALTAEQSVSGATSNPTIFANAICGSDRYDAQLRSELAAGADDPRELFLALALEDVRRAAELMRPLHDRSGGREGFVSFECTPDVAYDTQATVAQALELWRTLKLPNVMIKVPATEPGIAAIEELTAHGVNVNVTLLFAVERYEQVIEAHLRGLEHRVRAGKPLAGIESVASFFVSRVDARADAQLSPALRLRGRVGVANARVAYSRYESRFAGHRWEALAQLGASPQRPLWASTSPKDPGYRDVVYLEQLALPGSILTVPESTLLAFADHGDPGRTEPLDPIAAERTLATAAELPAITRELERDGVSAFADSYRQLLACIQERVDTIAAERGQRGIERVG